MGCKKGHYYRPDGVFDSVIRRWGLSAEDEKQLLGIDPGDVWGPFQDYVANLVVGIFISLRSLPSDKALSWVKTPNDNPMFGGTPPLKLMLSDVSGLEAVYNLLKTRNGGPL